jgi:hypothetical protein
MKMTSLGLNLLSNYDSESEEEEILNVVQNEPVAKLPLPNEIKNLFDKETKELLPGFKINVFSNRNLSLLLFIKFHAH